MASPAFPPRSKIRQVPDASGGQEEQADNSAAATKDQDMENSDQAGQGSPDQGPQDSPQDIADGIGDGLMKLNDLFSQSQSIKPEEKQALQQIIQMYQALYQGLNGDDQSQQAPSPQGDQGAVPMEAGNKQVQPVM